MLDFELVLPCYNEGKSLDAILSRAVNAAMAAGFGPHQFQLVFVENGSSDESLKKLQKLKDTSLGSWFRIVEIKKNQGYGFGIWSGLQTTTAKYVGWSHADQQCDPKDAFTALALVSRCVFVKGARFGRNWKDRLVSGVFALCARVILGLPTSEINAQPKVFSSELLSRMKNPPSNFTFDVYVLYCAVKAGFEIKTIPVLFPPRVHGVSNWAGHFLSRYKTILGMIRYMWTVYRTEGRAR